MKVIIELPNNWLDTDLTGNLDWMTKTVKQEVARQVERALVTYVLKETKMPKIEIKPEEVKDRMLTILAERALEDRE